MKKEDLIKLFVAAVVILFVVEMFALGASIAGNNSTGPEGQKKQSGRGFIEVNATVDYYEPQISISGNSSGLEDAIARLKLEGKIQNDSKNEYGARVLYASESASIKEIAGVLKGQNATVSAYAVLVIPSAEVISPSGNYEAVGGTLRYPISPDVEQGGQVGFDATVNVVEGQIISFENIKITAGEISYALVQVPYENVAKGSYVALVPWEKRAIGKDALLLALREIDANATLSYEEKSYALPQPQLSAQEANALNAQAPSYVVSVSQNAISVQRGFADAQKVQDDMNAFGLQVQLPPSRIVFSLPGASNAAQDATAVFESQNVSIISIEPLLIYRLTLPQTIGAGNYALSQAQRSVQMPLNASGDEGNVSVLVEFEHVGSEVTAVKSITPQQ